MRVASIRRPRVVDPPEPAGGYAVVALLGMAFVMGALAALAGVAGWSLSPFTWYLARASGMTLYLLLWLTVILGLGLTTTLLDRFGGRATIYSVHQFATRLAYGFVGLHLVSLAADPTVPFGAVQLLVPFAAGWREPWTGLGVLAFELTVIIGISSGLRRLTGFRAFRVLHWLSFPLFALAALHGIGSGTDSGEPWAQVIYVVTIAIVVCLALYRALRGCQRARPPVVRREAPLDRLANDLPRLP